MGTRKQRCFCWPVYSCVICNSIASLVFCKPANRGDDRFAHLEINRPVLDLDDGIVVEGAIERMEIIIGRFRPIVFQVAPIEVMVVDESAVEDDRRREA